MSDSNRRGEQMTIGAFARRTGLSVSAVRFYGDRGLVPPASVDPSTGYRSYDPGQVDDAVLVRDLRRLGLGLRAVAAYLAASATERSALIERHLAERQRELDDARSVAHTLHPPVPQEPPVPTMTVPTAAFLDALEQVLPAAGRDPELPVLTCVLIEAKDGSLRLVATDRYRLAIRDLAADGGLDAGFRALVPAETLRRWHATLPRDGALQVGVVDAHLVVRAGAVELRHPTVSAEFPAYEAVLYRDDPDSPGSPGLVRSQPPAEVVVDRAALLDALDRLAGAGDAVLVQARSGRIELVRREERVTVEARCTGGEADVALDPTFAHDAVTAAIGPDIVVAITDALLPVVFRSADDGTYTTLLMPVARP